MPNIFADDAILQNMTSYFHFLLWNSTSRSLIEQNMVKYAKKSNFK